MKIKYKVLHIKMININLFIRQEVLDLVQRMKVIEQ